MVLRKVIKGTRDALMFRHFAPKPSHLRFTLMLIHILGFG